jgi:hypothetical protein
MIACSFGLGPSRLASKHFDLLAGSIVSRATLAELRVKPDVCHWTSVLEVRVQFF